MSSNSRIYGGDKQLAELLRAAGIALPLGEIKSLMAGIAAAPRPLDDNEWLRLVASTVGDALRGQLIALYEILISVGDGVGHAVSSC